MENIRKDKTVKFFISVIGLVVIGFTLRELSTIFIPFVIAYFLFFAFSPMNEYLSKLKIPKFAIILFDILIIVLATWGVSAFIIGSFSQFTDQLPVFETKLNQIVRNASLGLGIKDPFYNNFTMENLVSHIDYKPIAGNIFTSTFSLLGSVFFILFFFVFVVTGHNNIYEAIKKRFVHRKSELGPEKLNSISADSENKETMGEKLERETSDREDKLAGTFKNITEQIQRYILTKICVNLGAGISVFIVCLIFRIDFPIVWALFTFLFNFIPSLGSAIALVLPVIFVLIQTGSAGFTILIAAIIGALQTLFFNILEPQLIGRRLNLNPLLILLSVLLWGYVFGIIGMLLSVPLTAIIKIIMSNSESRDMQFLSDLMSKDGGE
jgi:predicted PurR-regulated permease PerM